MRRAGPTDCRSVNTSATFSLRGARSTSAIRLWSMTAIFPAICERSTLTTEIGGTWLRAKSVSPMPITEMSSGTRRPLAAMACSVLCSV